MNKKELINEISDEHTIHRDYAEIIIAAVDAEGWLRNPGEPIDPVDIRKGDRVRTEYEGGDVIEEVARIDRPYGRVATAERFLLDRPKPGLPTEVGAVIRASGVIWVLDRNGKWRCDRAKVGADRFYNIDWEVVA